MKLSEMSCGELCLPRELSHSTCCPLSTHTPDSLYLCSWLLQIKGWKELKGRKLSQYLWIRVQMQCRQHFPQELSWSASFSPDISGTSWPCSNFPWISFQKISYCQIMFAPEGARSGQLETIYTSWFGGCIPFFWCAVQRKFPCGFKCLFYNFSVLIS